METGGRFKNSYALLNPRALKSSMFYTNRIFQCMGETFCVEFQRCPLKFHAKYLTHTLKDIFLYKTEISRALKFKSSHAFLKRPQALISIMPAREGEHFNDKMIMIHRLHGLCFVMETISIVRPRELRIPFALQRFVVVIVTHIM